MNFDSDNTGFSRSGIDLAETSRRGLLLSAGAVVVAASAGAAQAQPESPGDRLKALGLELPAVTKPIANFVHWRRAGDLVLVSGQLPMRDGKILHPGRVGVDVSPEQATEAARLCVLHVLAQAQAACDGDLSRIRAWMRLEGYVASDPSFTAQPAIINGASDLMVSVLGEAGRHTRIAVGVTVLPLNAPVEIAGAFVVG
jgi:enamine deaminase RidA (YjgF/YER057c/UK114 family)